MATWIALLRGVNLGPHNRLPMAQLRTELAARGLADVRTLIQTGNVVFESRHRSARAAADAVHVAIREAFDLDITVFMRTTAELTDVIAADPFTGENTDGLKLNVIFLDDVPPAATIRAVEAFDGGPERVRVIGREMFWLRQPYYRETIYTPAFLTKHFGREGTTTRTMDVVRRIADLARPV